MDFLNKQIRIKYIYLKFIAYFYSLLPLLFFFAGWLKWYYFMVAVIAVSICLYLSFINKTKDECNEGIDIKVYLFLLVCIIAVVYAWLCGIGRLWAQSKDYPWRNAIFRDLILKDWPVFYEKYNGALVYYIGIWLPAAFLGKISLWLGASSETAFIVGNIFFLAYISIGIIVLFLLIFNYLRIQDTSKVVFAVLMFIFFSGMDILGSIEPLPINDYHLEWWAEKYQYSSFTTCLCWVFNQALIPWMITIILIKDRKVQDFVFLGMMCLLSGPLPFVGLFVYCVMFGIEKLIKSIKKRQVIYYTRDVFSFSNIISSLLIFPFIGLYFISNNSFSGTGLELNNVAGGIVDSTVSNQNSIVSLDSVLTYVLFCAAEFLVYGILIIRKYRKDFLYYLTIVMLFLFPFGQIGYGYDFPMRASIPSLFVLYLLCVKFILEESQDSFINTKNADINNTFYKFKRYTYILMVCCLLLGACTPLVEFYRGFRQVIRRGINDPFTDYIVTLDGTGGIITHYDYTGYEFGNFVSIGKDDEVFFKYICK